MSLPGGSTREFAYDPLMRVKSIASKDPAGNPPLGETHPAALAGMG